jgi:phospholipid/cholesterol/gamma-HCH transport system substrate-binding protein
VRRVVVRRWIAVGLLAAAVVALAAILSGGDDGYVLNAKFRQAGGLREGFTVRVDGAPVGKIDKLTLDKQDNVVAKLKIDKSAAPMGRNVRATARAADLLGEKFVDLEPGNRADPAPSGTTIPPSRTGLAVELDDVINAVDLPTQQALKAFINEQGTAYVGRGHDLGALLAALPSSLDRTGELLNQFGSDNAALGRLVEESDRVVGSVARERASLGRLVSSAAGTLTTLGRRSTELRTTVERAPGALVAARRALTALEGAAVPLQPAARGLRATAPALTSTLKQLPAFTKSARPTLRTVRDVSPALQRLGRDATPVVRRMRPLAGQLAEFGAAFDPVTQTLDKGIADVLGVLEGWARATQGHDGASHVFRFGLTGGTAAFADILPIMRAAERQARQQKTPAAKRPSILKAPKVPKVKVPEVKLPPLLNNVTNTIKDTLDKVTGALGIGDHGGDPKSSAQRGLLDYLLKP